MRVRPHGGVCVLQIRAVTALCMPSPNRVGIPQVCSRAESLDRRWHLATVAISAHGPRLDPKELGDFRRVPARRSELGVARAEAQEPAPPAAAAPTGGQPNIIFIMGDDIGWFNIGAYHHGIMAGRTPNLDKLAAEGMLFTDYYAEASCTAGRANFITGELPIRTGLTTVGQAGSPIGIPAQAPTIATALKSMGYATGQFGKNHLGDSNEFLPTVHGFDEFFGYLYHLDAMEDPAHPNYPQDCSRPVGPRNMVHSWATDTDDPTEQPRWGKIGKQKIEDAGTLYPEADEDRRRRDPR